MVPVLAAVGQLDRRARGRAAQHVLVQDVGLLGGHPVGEHLHTVGLAPIVVDVPIREHHLCDRDGRVAIAAVGQGRVHVGHFQWAHAHSETAERLGRVAVQVLAHAQLVGHLRDRFLAQVGRQLRIHGVVGGERRLHQIDRLVRGGVLERFHFVGRDIRAASRGRACATRSRCCSGPPRVRARRPGRSP